jgi:DNA-directed RNA polymerase subunit RPC12/RpoP
VLNSFINREILKNKNKMALYKCFNCGKQISHKTLEKRFVCPACGSKIFYKPRKHITKVKAA